MIENLLKFGLSPKEAVLYLSLIEAGSSSASELAKRTDTNRSTTYVLLDALIQRGFVSVSEQDSVKTYIPSPPERLVQYMKDHVKKYTELVEVAESIVPELRLKYAGSGPKPRVCYYEGLEGVKTAYENTLAAREAIRAYASIKNMHDALPDYFPEYYRRRAANGIHIRAIFPNTEESRERQQNNQAEDRACYLVPKELYSFSPEINIYDDKVVFFSWLEHFALEIESKEIADAMKKSFELSWIGARSLQENH